MSLPRVVFLSAPPHGEEILAFLQTLPCEIVYSTTVDELPVWEYADRAATGKAEDCVCGGYSREDGPRLSICCPACDDTQGPSAISDYDIGLNFLGTHKIPAEEVNRPKRGWVNFHPAPLPEYGGRNVAFHALENYEERFGATVHYMEEEFDTGPILAVYPFSIAPEWTAGDLMNEAVETLKSAFRAWVPVLLQVDGKMPAKPQDPSRRHYFKKEPINDVVEIYHDQVQKIRARTFHPKHHARVVIGGKRYKIVPEE
jgi:methionyl-tRNA formyltransferase